MKTACLKSILRHLPMALVGLRFAFAFLILAAAYFMKANAALLCAVLMGLGLFSDIIDGIIARRLGVATPLLRRLDSQCDLVFWLSCLGSAHLMYPLLLTQTWPAIVLLLALELIIYVFSLLKFKREACTHAYSAKLYGLGLGIGVGEIMLYGNVGIAWHLMAIFGVIACMDVLLILIILPSWAHDIHSFWHALRKRYAMVSHHIT